MFSPFKKLSANLCGQVITVKSLLRKRLRDEIEPSEEEEEEDAECLYRQSRKRRNTGTSPGGNGEAGTHSWQAMDLFQSKNHNSGQNNNMGTIFGGSFGTGDDSALQSSAVGNNLIGQPSTSSGTGNSSSCSSLHENDGASSSDGRRTVGGTTSPPRDHNNRPGTVITGAISTSVGMTGVSSTSGMTDAIGGASGAISQGVSEISDGSLGEHGGDSGTETAETAETTTETATKENTVTEDTRNSSQFSQSSTSDAVRELSRITITDKGKTVNTRVSGASPQHGHGHSPQHLNLSSTTSQEQGETDISLGLSGQMTSEGQGHTNSNSNNNRRDSMQSALSGGGAHWNNPNSPMHRISTDNSRLRRMVTPPHLGGVDEETASFVSASSGTGASKFLLLLSSF